MKNFICGLLAISSLSAFANSQGTPEQDPVVKKMRQTFAESVAPSEADLELGRKWKCVSFSSGKEDFRVSGLPSYLILSSFDGIIKNEGTAYPKYLVYENTGLIGADTVHQNGAVLVIRVTAKGDLVSEYSAPALSLARERRYDNIVTPAIHDQENLVLSYQLCPKK